MTVSNLLDYVRQGYNATGDNFWSDAEIYNLMYQGCLDMARECNIIEGLPTVVPTIVGTQAYAYPTNVIAIKRITYDGKKLQPITFREDDAITGLNQSTTSQGTPQYYSIWNGNIYLRPIPGAVANLQIYSISEPAAITASSTLAIPSQFHLDLKYYCLAHMALKDSNINVSELYLQLWEKAKMDAKKWQAKKKRTDAFNTIQDEDNLIETYLGVV